VTGEGVLNIDYHDFKKFAAKAKDNKGGGPSGRHYGQYLVFLQKDDLLGMIFQIMKVTLKNGIVLERRKTVYQLLLLKHPTGSKIHRFWNTTLVEIYLMFIMKTVWANNLGDLMQAKDTLTKIQYARKEQVTQNGVLNKRLRYNLQLVMKEESFQLDNDAMSCYTMWLF